MHLDFKITDGIYLVQGPYEIDPHNCFDFQSLNYSVRDRALALYWKRSEGEWVTDVTPTSVVLVFRDVSEFRYLPRDAELPFTEDDCVDTVGYWSDEEWADGVTLVGPGQEPDPDWPIAIEFRSGATIIVRANAGHAQIET